jgi:hypothetical protein
VRELEWECEWEDRGIGLVAVFVTILYGIPSSEETERLCTESAGSWSRDVFIFRYPLWSELNSDVLSNTSKEVRDAKAIEVREVGEAEGWGWGEKW